MAWIRGELSNWLAKDDLSQKGMWEQRLESGEGASPDKFWGKNVPGQGTASADVPNQKVTSMFDEEQGGQVVREKECSYSARQ